MSLVRCLLARSWRLVAFAIAAGVISGLAGAGVIAVLTPAAASPSRGLLAMFVALALLSVVSKCVSEVLLTRLGQATIAEVRLLLSRRIVEAPLRRIQDLGGHRLLAALNDDAAVITQALVYLPMVCVNGATVAGCLVYLAWISGWALVAVLAAIVAGVVVFELHQRRALRYFSRARETSDALFDRFRALTGGIKELKMHRGRGAVFLDDRLGRTVSSYRDDFVAGMTVFSVASSWATAFFYAVLGLTVFVLPDAGATLALLYLMAPLALMVEIMPALGRAGVALDKWKELGLALRPDDEARAALAAPAAWECLELVGVTHRYHRENEDGSFQLGPIDLSFRPGELVFLVGGNGSGKTTLAMLLLGLYAPEAGEIRLDGKPIDESTRDAYRQLFSVVFADYHLFDDLLGVGDPGERARRYLTRLQLDQRVRIDERGEVHVTGLSQGQRKRLALLVAALEDRPFYVFDEWASDQDPQFRKVFYTELLPELRAQGKTAFVITHDEQYLGVADRCLRMDYGRLTRSTP